MILLLGALTVTGGVVLALVSRPSIDFSRRQ
ncbi:hypothetical protein ABIA32_002113 [Streptacidiphilus sp. MAP12-20]